MLLPGLAFFCVSLSVRWINAPPPPFFCTGLKGGDVDAFTVITRAYEALTLRHELQEEEQSQNILIEVELNLGKTGLGIELEQTGTAPNIRLQVTGVVPGKAADLDGTICRNDVMVELNGRNIRGISLDVVFKRLLEQIQNSQAVTATDGDKVVRLAFLRKKNATEGQEGELQQ